MVANQAVIVVEQMLVDHMTDLRTGEGTGSAAHQTTHQRTDPAADA